jgi:hypothetical protein
MSEDVVKALEIEEARRERLHRAAHSDSIELMAAALAKAQLGIKGAVRDSQNPHFRSHYADLSAVWDSCHEQLNANGIAIVQQTETLDGKLVLVTRLIHTSGQWIRSEWPLKPTKDDPQGLGSAVTYARRYSLAAIAGVAPRGDDDDGNAASGVKQQAAANDPPKQRSWGELDGDKPQRAAPTELGDLPETVDRLPADVAKARRELERFSEVPFGNMKEAELKGVARTLDALASKAANPKNKLVLTTLAAVAAAEVGKRVGGAA